MNPYQSININVSNTFKYQSINMNIMINLSICRLTEKRRSQLSILLTLTGIDWRQMKMKIGVRQIDEDEDWS